MGLGQLYSPGCSGPVHAERVLLHVQLVRGHQCSETFELKRALPDECGAAACRQDQCCHPKECTGAECCDAVGACPPDQVCDGGQCLPTETPEVLCTFNGECGPGRVCIEGQCFATCAESLDCGDAMLCDAGLCVADTSPVIQCSGSGACGSLGFGGIGIGGNLRPRRSGRRASAAAAARRALDIGARAAASHAVWHDSQVK